MSFDPGGRLEAYSESMIAVPTEFVRRRRGKPRLYIGGVQQR